MNPILGILAFAALVAVLYGIQRMLARGGAMVEGAITGNTRGRGQEAVRRQIDFTAPVDGPQIIDRIRFTLDLGSSPVNGLKIGGAAEDGSALLISGAGARMEYVIDTESAQSGCAGKAAVAKWVESEGRVTSTETIERIHKHVRAAVEHFGGQFTETVNS
jgi:hypothetical protein